jgi:hypothetical protein
MVAKWATPSHNRFISKRSRRHVFPSTYYRAPAIMHPLAAASSYRKKVIAMWVYRCYVDGQQPNLWRRWYDAHPDYQGSHDSIFNALEQRLEWKEPWTKFFDKKNRILEVRLNGNVKYRILGYCSSSVRMEFIVIAICSHKQQVYDPPDIRKTAVKRKAEIESDPERAVTCVRPQ